MNFLILGAGGIGSFYGAKLISFGHNIKFIARGEHLKVMQQYGLKLQHPKFSFDEKVNSFSLETMKSEPLHDIDAVIITTKSTSTNLIAKELSSIFNSTNRHPFIVSLQNGVENEDILCNYFQKNKIIGGLARKIGAHIIKPGIIEATGAVETIIGAIEETKENQKFMEDFSKILNESDILCEITNDIKLELWKKLIINNGVNAICALLKVKTGIVMYHEKLSRIVYGLMNETAIAAKAVGVNISKESVQEMYELIKKFDSIKPSMLVDVEHNRPIELDEICTVVIKNCELQNLDAPYTRTISTLLSFDYIEN